ncbi:MAG: hypothetical protein ACR2KB_16805 [Chitinophagaceae bacterium]
MKAFRPARLMLSILVLVLITFSFEACQKKNSFPETMKEEFAMRSNGNANALPHTKQYPADVATQWFRLLTDISKTKPYVPPPTLRIFAYSGMALYESVVPGMPSYQSVYKYFTGNTIEFDKKKDYYWPASANAAIARISSRIMQDYPAPNLVSVQALESSFNASFKSIITAEQLEFSNAFGKYVADKIYDWSKTDGTLKPDGMLALCPPYIPLGGPGNWVPTPPAFFPAAGACQGSLRTFIPNIANSVLPPPHPPYSEDPASAFYQAANEVYNTSLQLTPDDLRLVNNWRDIIGTNYNQPAHMLRLVTNIIIKEKINLEDASVLFAKQTIAAFDAIVAASKAKFHFSLLRPVTYIRNIMGHSSWNSVFPAPQLPSYPAYHGLQASSVYIMKNYFGEKYSFIDNVHHSLYGSWQYASFDELMGDIGNSGIQSGTEFRFAVDAAKNQGFMIGQLINQLPFKKP